MRFHVSSVIRRFIDEGCRLIAAARYLLGMSFCDGIARVNPSHLPDSAHANQLF